MRAIRHWSQFVILILLNYFDPVPVPFKTIDTVIPLYLLQDK